MDDDRTRLVLTRLNLRFGIVTSVLVIGAHAFAYMTHEYSHTFMAWALGWTPHPFALDYGKPTLYNILFLGDVDYVPIFAAGRGISVAAIALAGTFLENGLLYFVLYLIAGMGAVASSRWALSLTYWVALMCAGNVVGLCADPGDHHARRYCHCGERAAPLGVGPLPVFADPVALDHVTLF